MFKHFGRVTRKHVFGVFSQVKLKPACSATRTENRLESLDIEMRDISLSRKRKTMVLTSLGVEQLMCPLSLAYAKSRFSHDAAHFKCTQKISKKKWRLNFFYLLK